MNVDLVNSQQFNTILAPISMATNNNATVGFDTKGYDGIIAVRVNMGVVTAGDAGMTFTVRLQASATNAASNATNCVGTIGSTLFTSTTNNTASAATLTFDKRAEYRYMFLRTIITAGNSPAAPFAITAVGQLQMQPN